MRALDRIVKVKRLQIGQRAEISRSLLSVGSVVNGRVEHSVLSPGVYVEEISTLSPILWVKPSPVPPRSSTGAYMVPR